MKPDVRVQRQEKEESRQHVAALGCPGDRLDAQRMQRERRGCDRGGHEEHGRLGRGTRGEREAQQTHRQRIEHDRVGDVQERIRQMIARRVHPPELVVEGEGQPGERNEMALDVGEHPPQLARTETTEEWILGEVGLIVEVDESVAQRRDVGDRGRERHEQARSPPYPPPRARPVALLEAGGWAAVPVRRRCGFAPLLALRAPPPFGSGGHASRRVDCAAGSALQPTV